MRIAIFHNLPSGGAKRTLYESARRLALEHQLDVYTLSCANHTFADLQPFSSHYHITDFSPSPSIKSPFGRINQGLRLLDLFRLRSISKYIAQMIDKNHYDVVFVQPCQFESTPSILRYLEKTPTVYYCHEPLRLLYETIPFRPYSSQESKRRQVLNRLDPLPPLYYSTLRRNDYFNIHNADTILVNSNYIRDAVKRIYRLDAKVCYHGVDAELFRPFQQMGNRDFLFSVGSLTPLKGFDFLIEAVSLLPEQHRLPLVIASNFQNPPEVE